MIKKKKARSVIWIASYPKSGNTWVQGVVRAAGKSFGFPCEDLDVYKMKAENRVPVVVGGVRSEVTESPTTVLKTHSAFPKQRRVHAELGLKTVGFVYVMRNPLDMLLSYINFTRMQYKKRKYDPKYQESLFIDLLGFERPKTYEEWLETPLERIERKNLDHAMRRFTELDMELPLMSGVTGGSWLSHCESWREAGENMHSVFFRYEDLLEGPDRFLPLAKLFDFPDEVIIEAVNTVNKKQRELRGRKIFYNKMTSYYYPGYFSEDVISDFLDRFEENLRDIGYGNLYNCTRI